MSVKSSDPHSNHSVAAEFSRHLADDLATLDQELQRRLQQGESIVRLLRRRAIGVARVLRRAWHEFLPRQPGLAMMAVGGSGRGELHPYSDADLLILADNRVDLPEQALGQLFNCLWDSGLILGHSVRRLSETMDDARDDVMFLTNLMEASWLAGDRGLLQQLRDGIAPDVMWPPAEYCQAKLLEQEQRHERFHDTAYNLEPNIKEAPGGLRDLQMMIWVALRHFGDKPIEALVSHGLLTEQESRDLFEARDFLWEIRWRLHQLAGRAEERLLFEYQRALAGQFGYQDIGADNQAVEQFMQRYYRMVMRLVRLNERVLQQYQEEFIIGGRDEIEILDESFQIHNCYLEARDERIFVRSPLNLLQLFLWLQQRPEIQGVRASTIRLVRQHVHLINDDVRRDAVAWNLFMAILQQPRRVYSTLQRMNRYGVLAELIPAFAAIVGRMQFDLFHVYTVDQHILFVIRNLRRFANGHYPQHFAHAIELFQRIHNPASLYLAALFHDIAKGRGGDHSELGARDVATFCEHLDISPSDRRLIVWLVEHHLLMSRTAQREDISDPEVIHRFARIVGERRRLQYLYILTVADIAATAPRLWTSWKDSLLWDLYQLTLRSFREGLEEPVDRELLIEETKQEALSLLQVVGIPEDAVNEWWRRLPEHALMRLKPDQLAWATHVAHEATLPCLAMRNLHKERISELFVHANDYDGLFATVVTNIEAMRCNVLSARVLTSSDHKTCDLFQLTDANGQALVVADQQRLMSSLHKALKSHRQPKHKKTRLPRRLREFLTPARIQFSENDMTLLWLECTDRPGLLSHVAKTLMKMEIRIHDARIATFGDRVEDVFMISDRKNQPLSPAVREELDKQLSQQLDQVLKEHE